VGLTARVGGESVGPVTGWRVTVDRPRCRSPWTVRGCDEISYTLAHVAETQPNCNGVRSGNVRVDVNGDGLVGTLAGSNNWGTLIYGGGVVGGGPSPVERSSQQVLPGELTWEQATKFAH